MTRIKSFRKEIDTMILSSLKDSMPEPKMLCAEFCNDFKNAEWRWAWSLFEIASGSYSVNKFIKENGFVKSTKKDATCILLVGERHENGDLISPKRHWLKLA